MSKVAEKQKIRDKYRGVSPDELEKIPAIEEKNIFEDDVHMRVAVYARVSTDDPRQTSSFELQRNHYTDLIDRHPNWHLVKIYADEGISGTSLKKRAAFNEMIADCEKHKIDLIITKSVSRFARNIYDCIGMVRMLAALKPAIGVLFETENILRQMTFMRPMSVQVVKQKASITEIRCLPVIYWITAWTPLLHICTSISFPTYLSAVSLQRLRCGYM